MVASPEKAEVLSALLERETACRKSFVTPLGFACTLDRRASRNGLCPEKAEKRVLRVAFGMFASSEDS